MAEIDYSYWARLDKWTPKEAALLLDGKNPDEHKGAALRAVETPTGYENAVKLLKILERVDWTKRYGQRDWEVKGNPLYIVAAMRTLGVEIPGDLLREIKLRREREQESSEGAAARERSSSAATKERHTMLKLILGLAYGGFGMDPESPRNMYAKRMREGLERTGIPLDDETIKKYIDEAKQLRRDILARGE
ncbi:hypothetical protein WCQ02_17955 [Paraburkholderia tropica]|uniref:hypothetical protein n=1 Tax=Paraburkholderia tropica TaxID=92647 RepID=UPI00301AA582